MQLPMHRKAMYELTSLSAIQRGLTSGGARELMERVAWEQAHSSRELHPGGVAASPLSHPIMTGLIAGVSAEAVCGTVCSILQLELRLETIEKCLHSEEVAPRCRCRAQQHQKSSTGIVTQNSDDSQQGLVWRRLGAG
jgi:hypothetical protein